MKKTITAAAALITAGTLTAAAPAENAPPIQGCPCYGYVAVTGRIEKTDISGEYRGELENYFALMKKAKGGTITGDEYEYLTGDGDKDVMILSESDTELIKSGKAAISFDWYSFDGKIEEYMKDCPFDLGIAVEIQTSPFVFYHCKISILEDPVITSGMLFSRAEVEDPSEIETIRFWEYSDISGITENHPDSGIYACDTYIRGVSVTDLSKKGWQAVKQQYIYKGRFDLPYQQFYVKGKGKLATGSAVINNIRYKFDSSGIFRGRYTGFIKSKDGLQYWRGGTLLRGAEFTVNGVRYSADINGIVKFYEVNGDRVGVT